MRVAVGSFFFGVLAVLSAPASAAISLSIQAAARQHAGSVDGMVILSNRGTEPAQDVRVSVDSEGLAWSSEAQAWLAPDQKRSLTFREKLAAPLKVGRYPLLVRVAYEDANSYPFNALFASFLDIGPSPAGRLVGALSAASIEKAGRLRLKVKNGEDGRVSVALRLFLPSEISVAAAPPLALEPGQEKEVAIDIRNFSALPGSSYPIYAVIEYDLGGVHHCELASSILRIERLSLSRRYEGWLAAAALILLALLAAANLRASRQSQ